MRNLDSRVTRLEQRLGTGACTCRRGGLRLSVNVLSEPPPEGAVVVRRSICPLHGPARIIVANLTRWPLRFVDVPALPAASTNGRARLVDLTEQKTGAHHE